MGIRGAWSILEKVEKKTSLVQLCLQDGKFDDPTWPDSEYVMGVDGNLLLTRILSSALKSRGQAPTAFNLATSRDLSIALDHLAQFLNLPCIVVFVFDGLLKSSYKHDAAPVPHASMVMERFLDLINILGFDIFEAKGEADADLGLMSRYGLVNGVLTEDSDVFLFGAKTVIRPNSLAVKLDSQDLRTYRSVELRRHRQQGLDEEQLILFALLVGNDYDPVGLKGCKLEDAIALARSPLSSQLQSLLKTDQASEYFRRKDQFRARLRTELMHNASGFLQQALPDLAGRICPAFPDADVHRLLVRPVTSSLQILQAARKTWRVRNPDVDKLVEYCQYNFSWDVFACLSKFRQDIFPGMCIRRLLQKDSQGRGHLEEVLPKKDWHLLDRTATSSHQVFSVSEISVSFGSVYRELYRRGRFGHTASGTPAAAAPCLVITVPSAVVNRSCIFP